MSGALIGRILGKYRIVEKLGAGALADVYRGIQLGLEREVAIKILPPVLAQDALMRERFRRASQVTAKLSHPNIITVFDSGEQDDVPFTVIEHLRSDSLEDRLENEGAMPVQSVVRLAQDLCKALVYAHERGVLHRGLTTACVKFDLRNNAIVTDFARAEHADGGAVEDLAAVGDILHAALTGDDGFEKPAALPAGLPEEIARFVERAQGVVPDRFRTAREMLDALKRLELTQRARAVSRALQALPPPRMDPEELEPSIVESSDSLGLLASLSSLVSDDEDRRAVAHAFGWAAPVFLFTLCGVFFLLY